MYYRNAGKVIRPSVEGFRYANPVQVRRVRRFQSPRMSRMRRGGRYGGGFNFPSFPSDIGMKAVWWIVAIIVIVIIIALIINATSKKDIYITPSF